MIPAVLHLRPSSKNSPPGMAAAVLIAGDDVHLWLSEIARWPDTASVEAKIYVLPVSPRNPRPGGALILPSNGQSIQPSDRVIACDEIFPGVWIPRGATLMPTITPEEAKRLFLFTMNLMHPALGLIGWEATDALDPGDLLAHSSNSSGCTWEMAASGPPTPPRLQSIRLHLDESDLSFLLEAGSGIGDKSHREFTKTKGLGEKFRDLLGGTAVIGLGAVGGIVGIGVAGLMGLGKVFGAGKSSRSADSASGNRPATTKPGFLEFLQKWAAQQTEALQQRRHRELDRLMKLLESNPEVGLRYALPLSGEEGARGFSAQAGDRLSLRTPSLGSMGRGGGVVDPWNLDNNWRWKLQQRYREVAAEELKNGRYERTAYIYGELLGDWRLAADALMQGGFFREAARLHLLKSKSQVAAAECFEKGGLLFEAIQIFAELKMHERCGDLFTKMGRRADAFRSYLEAIRMAGDRVTTARILTEKLRLPGWAASVLASGWPDSSEAMVCLNEHFQLLNRCRAEEECAIQTERLAQNSDRLLTTPEEIRAVAEIGRSLAFPQSRRRFALMGRLAVARAVALFPNDKAARKFIECLSAIDPEDTLLRTDVQRFLTRRVDPVAMPIRRRIDRPITPSGVLKIPFDLNILAFSSAGKEWLALGIEQTRQTVVLQSGDALGIFQPQSLGCSRISSAWIMAHEEPNRVGLITNPEMTWTERTIQTRERLIRVSPHRLPGHPLAAAGTRNGEACALVRSESDNLLVNLVTFNSGGNCLRTRPLGWADVPAETNSLPFACESDRAFLAMGNQVFMLEDKDGIGDPKLSSVNLPGIVSQITASRPSKRIRVAVAWSNEVVLLSPEEKWEPVQLDSGESERPALHFMPDGNLIIASNHEAKVVCVEDRVQTLATLCYSKPGMYPPIGVVSLDVSTCAILMSDGRIEIFKVEE